MDGKPGITLVKLGQSVARMSFVCGLPAAKLQDETEFSTADMHGRGAGVDRANRRANRINLPHG